MSQEHLSTSSLQSVMADDLEKNPHPEPTAHSPYDKHHEYCLGFRKYFETHKITFRGKTRWVMQKPTGGSDMLTEVIALECGQLYVGGDIDTVIFARNYSEGKERVHWLGQHDLDYYVVEKATIGMGRAYCTEFNTECAEWDLEQLAKEYDSYDNDKAAEIRDVDLSYGHDSVQLQLMDLDVDDPPEIGMCVCSKVAMAHAALQRLSFLLGGTK